MFRLGGFKLSKLVVTIISTRIMINVMEVVAINIDTKYLVRWGIPGWIFILTLSLYFTIYADDQALSEFNNKNALFVGVTFALIGVPLGYMFNQLHMYFDWVLRGNWNVFFKDEILIDTYLSSNKDYRERYRYLLAKKHEVGSVLVSFCISSLIILLVNFTHSQYSYTKWLYLIVVLLLTFIWWELRCYSTRNVWAHFQHLKNEAKEFEKPK